MQPSSATAAYVHVGDALDNDAESAVIGALGLGLFGLGLALDAKTLRGASSTRRSKVCW